MLRALAIFLAVLFFISGLLPESDDSSPKGSSLSGVSKDDKATQPRVSTSSSASVAGGRKKVNRQSGNARTWCGLVVAPEHRCSPYVRADYKYSQSLEPRIVRQLGGIYSPYTNRVFSSTRETDIEHMVATSEAHDSGLCAAPDRTRRRFASDLDNLTLASPSVNRRQKKGKDAAGWLPAENACWFAAQVVKVKQKYGLSIDRRERRALERVLGKCVPSELASDCDFSNIALEASWTTPVTGR